MNVGWAQEFMKWQAVLCRRGIRKRRRRKEKEKEEGEAAAAAAGQW